MKCGIVYPGNFTVWITCLIKNYEDAILGGLVKRGYGVSAAGADGNLTIESEAAAIIGLSVTTSKEEATASDISKAVKEVMDEHKFLYYSIVVSATVGASWYGSNITLPQKPVVVPPPIPAPDRGNLN
jgi:hypothetical protein